MTENQYADPTGFCNAFKDWDNNPTNPMIQMDVDEFFNMFMDRIEGLIKETPQKKMIQQHFGGQFVTESIYKGGCGHYTERVEPYIAISLQVLNKTSILKSLDAFVTGEMMEGDNEVHCEKCDKKYPTLRRCCIKKLPKHLILVLKRFEFNYEIY